MLVLQLFVDGDNLGALNLFARERGRFDDDAEQLGLLFAAHAAVAFAAARKVQQLGHAVDTRGLIGQAIGIVMERHKIESDRAFALLVKISQHSNVKLRDVADALTCSGRLYADDRLG